MKISIPLQNIPSHSQLHGGGFEAGFYHPVLGFDHLLAMIAVGMISTLYAKKEVFIIPSVFVVFMSIGSIFAIKNINFLDNEFSISLSLIVLGFVILLKNKLPIIMTISFVGFFGFFHGHAHGTEMPGMTSLNNYILGFILSTSLLHILGILLSKLSQ